MVAALPYAHLKRLFYGLLCPTVLMDPGIYNGEQL